MMARPTGVPLDEFLNMVRRERARQDAKWGVGTQRDPDRFLGILMEEVGEVAEAVLEGAPPDALLDEIVQVAAVMAKFGEFGMARPAGVPLSEFLLQVRREHDKWGCGLPAGPLTFLGILTKQVGRVAKAVLEEHPPDALVDGLVQVATVMAKFAEFGVELPAEEGVR